MKNIRVISLALAILFVFSAAVSAAQVKTITGETSHTEKTLYKGVTWAEINTNASTPTYNKQHINVVTFDLAQRDLYLETAYYNNHVRVNYSYSTTTNTTKQYNANHADKTAIAAINGDMWMQGSSWSRIEGRNTTFQGCSDAVVKKELTVSRAFNIIDGEIYTTQHMEQETPYPGAAWSFGITDDYVPTLGQPYAEINMKNVTKNKTVSVDGINRLPANNAIVMYTDRLMGSFNDFALDDAYEYLIEFDKDYKMCHGADVTGSIKAVYGPDSASSAPKITEKQMVITVRGTKTDSVKDYAVGDIINFTVKMHERNGKDDYWQRVKQCIGGNIVYVKNGVFQETYLENGYPTTLLGYDRNGKIIMLTMDGRNKGGAGGTTARLKQLVKDLDLYEAFIVDGGKSSTMIVAEDNTYSSYKVVNTPAGGSELTVNNSMILAFGPQRQKQGEVELPVEIKDPLHVTFPKKAYVTSLVALANEATYAWEDKCLKMTANNIASNPDPWVYLNYAAITGKANADDYKYITCVYKIPETCSEEKYYSEIYCQCNGNLPEGGQSTSAEVKRTGQYEYVTFDASALTKWTGTVTTLRIDFFAKKLINGDCMYLHDIILSESADEGDEAGRSIADALNDPTATESETETETEPEIPDEPDDPTHVTFPKISYVTSLVALINEAAYGWEDECLKMTASEIAETADPWIYLNYQAITGTANADDYKYITYVYKIPNSCSEEEYYSEVYCQCSGNFPESGQSAVAYVKRTGQFEYVTFDASALSKWTGTITSLRIDFFAKALVNGDCMYLHDIILSKTEAEANAAGKSTAEALNGTTGQDTTEKPDDQAHVTFPKKSYVDALVILNNESTYGWEDGCLKMTASETAENADPWVFLNYDAIPGKASADDYKYITLVYMIPKTCSEEEYYSEIYCQCNGNMPEKGQSAVNYTKRTGQFEYLTFDASELTKWTGNITSLRIDFFAKALADGDCMYLHDIILSKTSKDAVSAGRSIAEVLNAPSDPETEESGPVSEEVSSDTDDTEETGTETGEPGTDPETDPEGSETEPAEDTVKGDCNGDGEADNKDVVALFRYVSTGTSEYDPKYDFNGDKEVNNKD
ncbi:MAG: phosphodiester glycosidase family protein, partial [Clostridia bacterium]|nr:phosphodiester glycosidase family protein [Clostridia bacterium]